MNKLSIYGQGRGLGPGGGKQDGSGKMKGPGQGPGKGKGLGNRPDLALTQKGKVINKEERKIIEQAIKKVLMGETKKASYDRGSCFSTIAKHAMQDLPNQYYPYQMGQQQQPKSQPFTLSDPSMLGTGLGGGAGWMLGRKMGVGGLGAILGGMLGHHLGRKVVAPPAQPQNPQLQAMRYKY